ncbi:MAG: methionine synthase [Thermoplasmatales archaeon]|nr:methionine synthase [Thermoplasmatales archaeon]
MNKAKTTVIGSYPVNVENMDIMNGYFSQTMVSWDKYIKSAVNDMVGSGIELISDGQTRDPFVNIFTRKLKGCRIRDRTEIIDKVEFDGPITVEDQKYVRELMPKDRQLIGLITGPFTLTKSSVDLFYNDEKELAFDFAKALRQEVQLLQKHVDMISIDEPFFSMELPEYGKELIKTITKDLSCPTRLHVCGDVSKIVSDVLDMPVDILSHEFKASPKLFNAFKQHNIAKNICLGSVRSDNSRVEPVDEIVEHINKGIDVFGDKISQIAPDCGQRMLPRDAALQKLKNLVEAGEEVYG